MAGKDRDVNLNVTATEETGPATAAAGRNIDGLQRKVDGFNTKKPTAEVTRFTSAFTQSAKDGDSAMTTLQKSIDDTERRIAKIRADFNAPGGNGLQLFGDLKNETANLRVLQNALKSFTADAANDGDQAGQAFTKSFKSQVTKNVPLALSNPEVAAGVGAATVALLGPITSAVSAAISAGVGLGVIGAAAAIQHNNPAIIAALTPLKADVVSVFKGASDTLVNPLVDALGSVDAFVKREGPEFGRLFGSVAGAISPVVSGLEHLAAAVLPELTKLAGDFTDALADPEVKRALDGAENSIKTMFSAFGDHPQQIHDGFIILADAVQIATNVVTGFITVGAGLEQIIHPLLTALQVAADVSHGDLKKAFIDFTQGTNDASQGIGVLSSATANLTTADALAAAGFAGVTAGLDAESKSLQAATDAVDAYLNKLLGLDNADLAAKQGISQLTSEWQKSKRPIDENTAAGQKNVALVLSQVGAAQRVFDTTEAQTGSIDKATLAYDAQIGTLHKTLAAMGLTESQIDSLIGKYGNIPSQVSTDVNVIGVPAAKAAAAGVAGALHLIPKDVTSTVHVRVAESAQSAQLLARATGKNIAFGAGDYLDSGFAFAPGGGGRGGDGAKWTMPPVQIDHSSKLTTYLDGEVVARSVDRHTAAARTHQRHAARVGAL